MWTTGAVVRTWRGMRRSEGRGRGRTAKEAIAMNSMEADKEKKGNWMEEIVKVSGMSEREKRTKGVVVEETTIMPFPRTFRRR
jgi:hypothetical protein